jgi:RNA polymerase sigma-70 factor (ECF subfamily)
MATQSTVQLDLIEQARAGNAESLATLAEVVRERVYAYIRRVTLQEDLAQDLTQDTLVSVLASVGTLEQVSRFWPWVFRIASNKIKQHYREEGHRRVAPLGDREVCEPAGDQASDGLTEAARSELIALTRVALAGVSERHRAVLALRFFEDLPHTEIARILECSELATRAALFRAKHAVSHELKRHGVNRSLLGAALLAFGQATVASKSASAVTISAAALAESALTGLLSIKVKVGAVAAAVLLVICGLCWWTPSASSSTPSKPTRWAHFAFHRYEAVSNPITCVTEDQSQGIYEQWCHFPEGPDGPMLFRMQRWSPDGKQRWCWWVENGDANYYIHAGEKIHINNQHLDHFSLPTDSAEYAAFVRGVEGRHSLAMLDQPGLTFQRNPRTGFVVGHTDTRFPSLPPHRVVYEYSDQDPHLFDAPAGMEVVDERDAMHKRGWTYFEVEGRLEGRAIGGCGCLPLAYNASKEHPAWLRLSVDGKCVLADDGKVALRLDPGGKVAAAYPGLTLFRGMARPWMGFNTLDSIRRDAAGERIWFSTQEVEEDQTTAVTLVDDRDRIHYMLRYTVNMPRDILERIEIWRGPEGLFEEKVADLTLRYDEQMRGAASELAAPQAQQVPDTALREKSTVLWPLCLLKPAAAQIAVGERLAPAVLR